MKKWKIAGLFAMALMMSVTPLQAFATSPEFAYTAEKWASLQDNKLEYGEIADLISQRSIMIPQARYPSGSATRTMTAQTTRDRSPRR